MCCAGAASVESPIALRTGLRAYQPDAADGSLSVSLRALLALTAREPRARKPRRHPCACACASAARCALRAVRSWCRACAAQSALRGGCPPHPEVATDPGPPATALPPGDRAIPAASTRTHTLPRLPPSREHLPAPPHTARGVAARGAAHFVRRPMRSLPAPVKGGTEASRHALRRGSPCLHPCRRPRARAHALRPDGGGHGSWES